VDVPVRILSTATLREARVIDLERKVGGGASDLEIEIIFVPAELDADGHPHPGPPTYKARTFSFGRHGRSDVTA
jgi:hypothetical protein